LQEIDQIKVDLKANHGLKEIEDPVKQNIEDPKVFYEKSNTPSTNITTINNGDEIKKIELLNMKITDLRKLAKNLGVSGCEKEKDKSVLVSKIIEAESSTGKLL
jgi:NAD+--asparagine ADP-ribosyltransferase